MLVIRDSEPENSKSGLSPTVIRLGLISFFADVASEMLYPLTPIFLTSVLGASVFSVGVIEGVAEGIATGNAMDSQQGQLANLFGTQYNTDANRQLSRYGMDQGFYTAQRGQDQTGADLGANLMRQGQQGQWGPLNNANGIYGNYTGFGNTNNTQNSGGGWQGAVGGALGAAQLGQNMGWW